ncbi:hypothetical protein [Blastococcus montanus]|uniref:hypothetical protein n=1 Tax=Blastococcus montanus TaxID=3144973 RepID=UPI00320AD5E8
MVSGAETSMIPTVDFAWFPLRDPGLVSIPASFLLGYLGTVLTKEKPNEEKWAELEVRAFTGIGAEKAVTHQEASLAAQAGVGSAPRRASCRGAPPAFHECTEPFRNPNG